MWAPLLLVSLYGCGEAGHQSSPEGLAMADFHGLFEGASWTYRDDGETETSPQDEQLIHARYLGGGEVDLRRGIRWADSPQAALLVYALDSQFKLTEWDFAGSSGSGDLPLGSLSPAEGQSVTEGNWFCATVRRTETDTYYGQFDDVVQFECEGSDGPAGTYTYALDVGLVQYSSSAYTLDLVAPH